MMRTRNVSFSICIAVIAAVAAASSAYAQACLGTAGSGVWAERSELALGNAIGAGVSLAGRHVGFGVTYRHRDIDDDITGDEADVRFGVIIQSRRLQFCPLVTLGARREVWQAESDVELTSTRAAAAGGMGLGLELPLVGRLSLMPHVIGEYEYSGTYFQLDATSENDESAAWSGRITTQLGLLARYSIVYGGFITHWSPDLQRAHLSRFVAGITF